MDITYTIRFYGEWHCGSGLAAGADLDALVVKDANLLPFVPGKTVKGLVREAVENLLWFEGKGQIADDKRQLFIKAFGNSEDEAYDMTGIKNVTKGQATEEKQQKGELFFTNAELDEKIRGSILCEDLGKYMYRAVSSTAIKNGIAEKHSLRRMETVVPCELQGKILEVSEDFKDYILNGLKYIKRLGQNRNRGLGRCDFIIMEGGQK